MSLWFSGNAIALMQAGIEPLRTVGHTHLIQNRIHQLFIKYLCIMGRCKISVTFAPYSPAVGHTMCYLLCRCFSTKTAIRLWYTCFTKIFLCKNISCYLTPLFRHFYIVHFKYHFTIGISDYGSTIVIFKHIVHVHVLPGKAT